MATNLNPKNIKIAQLRGYGSIYQPFCELMKSNLSHFLPQVFFTISALSLLFGIVTTPQRILSLFRPIRGLDTVEVTSFRVAFAVTGSLAIDCLVVDSSGIGMSVTLRVLLTRNEDWPSGGSKTQSGRLADMGNNQLTANRTL